MTRLTDALRAMPSRWTIATATSFALVAGFLPGGWINGVWLIIGLAATALVAQHEAELCTEAESPTPEPPKAETAAETDPTWVIEKMLGHGDQLVDLVDGRHSSCTDGVDQVQSILGDAVNRLQENFTQLAEHLHAESAFVHELAARVAEQLSGDEQTSVRALALTLRGVLQHAIDQLVHVSTISSGTADRFQQMTAGATTMLGLLDEAETIRDETNILALNAAIEAAHAGDQGRTFGAVADEVRALSKKSSAFNSELASIAQEMRVNVEAANESVVELSKCEVGPAIEASKHLDQLVASLEESNQQMNDGLMHLGEGQRKANGHVAEAITALQFEDLARQRLGVVEQESANTTSKANQLWTEIRTALSGDESETCLEQRMAELEASILRLCADDAIHTPVDQTNMSEGSIELF